jgi:hypothetical protein
MKRTRPTKLGFSRLVSWAVGLAALSAMSCDGSSPTTPGPPDPPPAAWINALIAEIQSEPVTNPPSSLFSYRYRDETVYFRPSRCCDVMSDLYDEDGSLICHPDGGIAGRGDGNCPDFFANRSHEALIWQDPRT